MPIDQYDCMDVDHFGSGLARLHEVITRKKSRVEITRRGCDERCIIISKSELDSLEEALTILAGSEKFAAMHAQISQLAMGEDPGAPATI
jgi:PHD/YefM family antitoxin component YafN of YafNO toxin-antitoxin module